MVYTKQELAAELFTALMYDTITERFTSPPHRRTDHFVHSNKLSMDVNCFLQSYNSFKSVKMFRPFFTSTETVVNSSPD